MIFLDQVLFSMAFWKETGAKSSQKLNFLFKLCEFLHSVVLFLVFEWYNLVSHQYSPYSQLRTSMMVATLPWFKGLEKSKGNKAMLVTPPACRQWFQTMASPAKRA